MPSGSSPPGRLRQMTSVLRPSRVVPVTVRNHQRPSASLLEPSLQAQPALAVALELGREGLRRGDVLDHQADQPVEGLDQIDAHLARLVRAGPLDLQRVGRGVGEGGDVEQRLAAARLHVEHVAQDVLLLEPVRPLRLGQVQQALLRLGALQLQVVEGVLVGFEAHHLEDTRTALGLLGGGQTLGLAVLPLRGEGDLLQARQQHRVEVVALLDEDELAPAAVLAVEVDDRVAGGARAGEIVKETEVTGISSPDEIDPSDTRTFAQ
ncbi:MAG: hypothetical protein KatS3mg126_2268 [Lysobacteraceae bacterium]|nr:MAG: hypothetical protein KatS3mg126_2268 [Xanthomonadaceae bacterium]